MQQLPSSLALGVNGGLARCAGPRWTPLPTALHPSPGRASWHSASPSWRRGPLNHCPPLLSSLDLEPEAWPPVWALLWDFCFKDVNVQGRRRGGMGGKSNDVWLIFLLFCFIFILSSLPVSDKSAFAPNRHITNRGATIHRSERKEPEGAWRPSQGSHTSRSQERKCI